MAAKDDVVYCYSEFGVPYAVNASTGAKVSCPDNVFMRKKMTRCAGLTFSYSDKILVIVDTINHWRDTYEFVPLGVFSAERPKVTDDVELSFGCNDRMTLFDEDMDLEIEYPVKAKVLLKAICDSKNVPMSTASFINENAELEEKPDEFDNCTKRDIIRWIAEIAGSNAKINRDGVLELTWIKNTNQNFNEGNYTECRPYYYQTSKVDRLCSRDMDACTDAYEGNGSNTYLIQDNPFLMG